MSPRNKQIAKKKWRFTLCFMPIIFLGIQIFVPPALPAEEMEKLPKIIIIPSCEGTTPGQLQKAKEKVSNLLDVDLYTELDRGYLPQAMDLDLRKHDVVFIVGDSPAIFRLNQTLAEAKKKTTVVVIFPTYVEGNVDLGKHPWIKKYWFNRCEENFRRLMIYLGVKFCGLKAEIEKPIIFSDQAIYHPDAKEIFETTDDYLKWYADDATKNHYIFNTTKPTIGILFYRNAYTRKKLDIVDALIRAVEKKGCNVIALWGSGTFCLDKFFLKNERPVVDSIISLAYKLNHIDQQKGVEEARAVDVPILQALGHFHKTPQEWEKGLEGMATSMLPYVLYAEMDGIFEPMIVAGKVILDNGEDYYKTISYQIDWRVDRAIAWARLHKMKNSDKKIAITYYSEGGGKADIGANIDYYLDVPRSLVNLFKEMRLRGYNLTDEPIPDSYNLSRLMAEEGSNVGVWATHELIKRVKDEKAILIPAKIYLEWFSELPEDKRKEVIEKWGEPPGKIMVYEKGSEKYLVIPKLEFGNIILLPHPTWGFLQDEKVLYDEGAIPPHHQYIAFWFWLNREFKADAIFSAFTQVSLLPGKQVGLSRHDWGGLLLQNVPHIRPFPIQGNGGVQNKRRANALIVDYMPTIVLSELYEELLGLEKKIAFYEEAQGSLKEEYKQGILKECKRLKLDKDLALDIDSLPFKDLIGKLKEYLNQIKAEQMPYGTHTLGEPPTGEALDEMISSMLGKKSDQLTSDDLNLAAEYAKRIDACKEEIPRIADALEAKFILPGPIDDPIRNPDALPTGRNPYTFDTRSIPTKEAWEIGKRMAEQLLGQHLEKNKKYPQRIAFVLWSSETAKHHGIIEAEILYLLGVKPVWNKKERLEDIELISESMLKRPRIDVLVITSGLYREHYQNQTGLINKAVRLAAKEKERLNYVRQNTEIIKRGLLKNGYKESEASELSKARVFSEGLGAYSSGLSFAVGASKTWESDVKLSELYIGRMSYTYGKDMQDKQVKGVFKENLKTVEAGVFSRSSNVYGVLDHTEVAGYFGGLKLAVRNTINKELDMYITNLREQDNPKIETLEQFFHREIRSRYFNPKWIKGMIGHGYDGARYMAEFTKDLWLWDVTSPKMVTEDMWNEVNEVYIKDKYELDLKSYFDKNNPYAFQALIATMLDVIRKEYWDAPQDVKKSLAKEYALSIIKNDVACCYNVCNNPALNQMVVDIISHPGFLSPELVSQFKGTISKATGINFAEGAKERIDGSTSLTINPEQSRRVEGYEMVEEKKEGAKLATLDTTWPVRVIVFGFIGLLLIGWLQKK